MTAASIVLRLAYPARRLWWRIRRPNTFGVKALLTHGDGYLVVRHSYGDRRRWALPGGGYRPDRETPAEAVAREVAEELAIELDPALFTVVTWTVTRFEGKNDTLTILTAPVPTRRLRRSPELAEARWITDVAELGADPVSRWLLLALDATGRGR